MFPGSQKTGHLSELGENLVSRSVSPVVQSTFAGEVAGNYEVGREAGGMYPE